MESYFANSPGERVIIRVIEDKNQPGFDLEKNKTQAAYVRDLVTGHTCNHNIVCEALRNVEGLHWPRGDKSSYERRSDMELQWRYDNLYDDVADNSDVADDSD